MQTFVDLSGSEPEVLQAITKLINALPAPFPQRLNRLPIRELPAMLRGLETNPEVLKENPEDEDAWSDLDRGLRYLESKTQLVRMLLITRIKSDGIGVEEAEDIAAQIISENYLSDVYTAYDERQATS